MFEAAWANLDDLEPSAKAHPETLMFRLKILLAQDKPYEAAARGADYCRDWPRNGDFFLKTAEALMKLTDYEKALVLLRSAPGSLRRKTDYRYMVASCACLAGRLEEAKAALSECIHWDITLQQLVIGNPTFEPLWQSFGLPSEWGQASATPGISVEDFGDFGDWSNGHWIGPS